jgi:hypothetical protein
MTAPMPPERLAEILRALPPHPAPGTTSCMARELAAEVERSWAETLQATTDRVRAELDFVDRLAKEAGGCCPECDSVVTLARGLIGDPANGGA